MDSEAAVIRSEISHTRVELDRKIARLEERARELSPRQYARRHLPDHLLDRTIGAVLTLCAARMAWRQFRDRKTRRARMQEAMATTPF